MKRILLLVLLVVALAGFASAQKSNWVTINQAASTQNSTKLYVVDFYTSWCGWCKKMDSETFSDATVKKILDKYYIAVKFDAEGQDEFSWKGQAFAGNPSRNGRKSPHQFAFSVLGQEMGFPTTAIFAADKSLLTVLPGYYGAADYSRILWYFASGDYSKYSWDQYEKIFDKEVRPQMNKALGIK